MAASLDMSLDDIIANKRTSRGARTGGPSRGGGTSKRTTGPVRNLRSPQSRPRPYTGSAVTTTPNLSAATEGKILVSNLAYKVTENDLWELFTSMIGPVRQVNLNFDQNGRSKGTASVVFNRRTDAVKAVEKFRNTTLDGRDIKIEFVVAPNAGSIAQRIGGLNEARPSVRMPSGPRGSSIRGGRGGIRRSENRPKPTQEQLDAEMSEYMQIDEDSSQAVDSGAIQLGYYSAKHQSRTVEFYSMSQVPLLHSSIRRQKVIIHLDLDCFYCQVEQVRLGIPSNVPLAVQQWQGLIAVNYAARESGIQRHCTVTEARSKCPELQLVHVATYVNGEIEPQYHLNPHYATHKVSLDTYRRASSQIFQILQRYCTLIQRASVDEAYMDVTDFVNERLVKRFHELNESSQAPEIDWNGLGIIWSNTRNEDVDADKEKNTWNDWQLAIAAELASEIRETVLMELGYTCSAGIAHNKTLAKLCSALNKPNKQTVLKGTEAMNFMRELPFQKIRNLGGKLGSEIGNELKVETAGELWKFTVEELQAKFGMSTGVWLFNISRGIDTEGVVQRNTTKSMMASKSFRPPIKTLANVEHWMNILATELYTRVIDDYELNQRWPRTLVMHFKCVSHQSPRSKSAPFPRRGSLKSPDILSDKILELFKSSDYAFPCTNISAAATGLVKDDSVGSVDIAKFFLKSPEHRKSDISNASTHNSESDLPEKSMRVIKKFDDVSAEGLLSSAVKHQQTESHPFLQAKSTIRNPLLADREEFNISPLGEEKLSSKTITPIVSQVTEAPKKNKSSKASFSNPPVTGILQFFGRSENGNHGKNNNNKTPEIIQERATHSLSSETISCPKCNQLIYSRNLSEHQDFHFARELQKEERTKDREVRSLANSIMRP
ncbi:hypothetical protein G9A89_003738 [Geosiphon pyriformis]|nr:hypothetical protein G9A89_003738 [Geosiphon pyriformis]